MTKGKGLKQKILFGLQMKKSKRQIPKCCQSLEQVVFARWKTWGRTGVGKEEKSKNAGFEQPPSLQVEI